MWGQAVRDSLLYQTLSPVNATSPLQPSLTLSLNQVLMGLALLSIGDLVCSA